MIDSNDFQAKDYLDAVEDGLLMRKAGKWTAEKLHYLNRYLDIFITSMHDKPWRGINFIDLFSGPGKSKVCDTGYILIGSPLLSIQLHHTFNHYYFVDKNEKAINALKARCETSSRANRIQFFVGDSNQLVGEIVQEIKDFDRKKIQDQWTSLNLAFLDPEGFELQWKSVAMLGNVKRMDLIIYYPQMGLTREMPKDINYSPPTKIDNFFGNTQWRDIYRRYKTGQITNVHRALMDLYERQLTTLGYVDIREDELLMRSSKRKAPLYRLIFASKNELAEKFWKEAIRRDQQFSK